MRARRCCEHGFNRRVSADNILHDLTKPGKWPRDLGSVVREPMMHRYEDRERGHAGFSGSGR